MTDTSEIKTRDDVPEDLLWLWDHAGNWVRKAGFADADEYAAWFLVLWAETDERDQWMLSHPAEYQHFMMEQVAAED